MASGVLMSDGRVVTGLSSRLIALAPAARGPLGGWLFFAKVTKRTDDQGVYQCVSLYVISVFLAQRRLAPAS
jgi:hypothetical protein